MNYLIYKTTNTINGKIYIGAHKTPKIDDGYLGSGKLIKRAIKKHGRNNSKREILYQLDSEEEMFAKEVEILTEEFLASNDTYNIIKGGFGNTELGQYVVDRKIGIHALTFEERSIISKTRITNTPKEILRKRSSKAGKANWEKNKDKKFGWLGLSKEERIKNAIHANNVLREKGGGFFDPKVQSELGKRGGVKNKGTKWYQDLEETKGQKFRGSEEEFAKFLFDNPQFKSGRPYPKNVIKTTNKGRIAITDEKINIMILKDKLDQFLLDNPSFRRGRIFHKKRK